MSAYLSELNSDNAKGMLSFAEGKPLGSTGLNQLYHHIANMFGEDKLSLDDREKGTKDNSDKICGVANDPLGTMSYWRSADKPFSFLAACFEWNGFMEKGKKGARVTY